MKYRGHLGQLLAFVLAAFSLVGNAGATSANTDLSDIWWNPAESGWGMQMVNTGTSVFATVYVYDQNRSPTWLTGELTPVRHVSADHVFRPVVRDQPGHTMVAPSTPIPSPEGKPER